MIPHPTPDSAAPIAVIFNPAARSERASSLRDEVAALDSRIRLYETTHPGDATAQTRQALADGCQAVVAAGGDGTVNEIIRALRGSPCPLGVLPLGTVNVLALELGLPLHSLEQCWEIIRAGHLRRLDLGIARTDDAEIPFIQLAGAGLDAEVVRATSPESKKIFGPLSYVLALVEVSNRHLPRLHVELPSGESRTCGFVLIGNGRFYGGPLALFPQARMDDGLLDVLLFDHHSPWDLLRYVQGIILGQQHIDLPDVHYLQTPSLSLRSEAPVALEIDGEAAGHLPCQFSIEPSALSLFTPAPAQDHRSNGQTS